MAVSPHGILTGLKKTWFLFSYKQVPNTNENKGTANPDSITTKITWINITWIHTWIMRHHLNSMMRVISK